MKKTFAWLLILALLLCGCQTTVVDDTSAAFLPSGTESPDCILPTGTVSDAEKPDIFILEPHWDVDFHIDISIVSYLQLWLLTKEPLTEADIDVSLDIQTPYEIKLMDYEGGLPPLPVLNADGTVKTAGWFTYDLYLSYRGADWGDLAEKRAAANKASAEIGDLYEADALPTDSRIQELQAIVDTYNQVYLAEKDHYMALTEEQIPAFHAYQIWILFSKAPAEDETFTSLSLKIKGEDYSMDVGRVTLYANMPPEFAATDGAYLAKEAVGLALELRECRYNDGVYQSLGFSFTAEEDMVLTGLRLNENAPELQRIRVQQSSDGATAMDYFWDGTSKLRIPKGDSVSMYFSLSDTRFCTPGTEFRFYSVLEYSVSGESYVYAVEYVCRHTQNWYELYAEYIDGIDLEPYYTLFYYPFRSRW